MIITIDGEAGAGKTTVSILVARRMGYLLLESGGIYRALAWKALRERTDMHEEALAALAADTRIEIDFDSAGNRLTVDGRAVTDELRGPEMDLMSSAVSRFQRVREILIDIQRNAAEKGNLVAEGRDMGTVVFPDAAHKFYLTASLEVRSERRRLQMAPACTDLSTDEVMRQVASRDRQDTERTWSPLMPAVDAVVIDTTHRNAESVAAQIVDRVRSGGPRDGE